MRLREYETICIFRPYASPELVGKVEQKLKTPIETDGGAFVRSQVWGRKKLAYSIGKEREGLYVRFYYVAHSARLSEIDHLLSYDESILKYLTIKLNDRQLDVAALKQKGEEAVPDYFRSEQGGGGRDSSASYRGSYQDDVTAA